MCSLSTCDTKGHEHDEAVSVNNVLHHGREFLRRSDAFVRRFGPALRIGAMSLAPALTSASLPQVAATTTVVGQAADNYSQLRSQVPE